MIVGDTNGIKQYNPKEQKEISGRIWKKSLTMNRSKQIQTVDTVQRGFIVLEVGGTDCTFFRHGFSFSVQTAFSSAERIPV